MLASRRSVVIVGATKHSPGLKDVWPGDRIRAFLGV